jgi:hypothetical protein
MAGFWFDKQAGQQSMHIIGRMRRGPGHPIPSPVFTKRRHFFCHGGSITTKRELKKAIFW